MWREGHRLGVSWESGREIVREAPGEGFAYVLGAVVAGKLKWAGLDSNQRRRKASRFTVCPVWPLRNLPFRAKERRHSSVLPALNLFGAVLNASSYCRSL